VQAAGFRAVYCPEARVHHWVPADRVRLRYMLEWFFWSGITHAALDEDDPRPARSIAGLPLYLVRRLLVGLALAPAAALVGRAAASLDRAMDVAFTAGYAAQRWGLITLQRTAGQPVKKSLATVVSGFSRTPTGPPACPERSRGEGGRHSGVSTGRGGLQ
jgi:hypothetical protein